MVKRTKTRGLSKKQRWLLVVGLVALILAGSAYVAFSIIKSYPAKNDSKDIEVGRESLYEENQRNKYSIENHRRVDGIVKNLDNARMVLELPDSDGADVGELSLVFDDNTQYLSGSLGELAASDVIKVGSRVVVSYDWQNNKLISVWVDYDKG